MPGHAACTSCSNTSTSPSPTWTARWLITARSPRIHTPRIAPYTTAGPQHVGFAHPDVDALIARLSGTAEPSDRSDDSNYRRVYFDDPDGTETELFLWAYKHARERWRRGLEAVFPAGTYWLTRFAHVQVAPT